MTLILRFAEDLRGCGNSAHEIDLQVKGIPEEDWMSVFRSQHRPVRISKRLIVRPTWCDPVGQNDLVLDPGMAFGTGSHFTTRMCLELLDSLSGFPDGGRMLDLGTGSGILAIAGAFLGFGYVHAVDIDPKAVEVAGRNARDNHRENVVLVEEGSIEKAEGVYEIITANLSGSLLVKLAERICTHLAEGGGLIASGIMVHEKEDVITAFTRCGLKTARIMEKDVWVAALFQQPQ
jgi:ribosomal protein L11 methyltransferase